MIKEGWQELSPGAKRRWEPEGGIKKHNERIHKESKQFDKKDLPFTFRKPKKSLGSATYIECPYCSKGLSITSKTVMVVCSGCSKLIKI